MGIFELLYVQPVLAAQFWSFTLMSDSRRRSVSPLLKHPLHQWFMRSWNRVTSFWILLEDSGAVQFSQQAVLHSNVTDAGGPIGAAVMDRYRKVLQILQWELGAECNER